MRWTHVLAVGAAVSIGLTAACAAPSAAPSGNSSGTGGGDTPGTASAALDPTAKGPAPEVPGAKPGGTLIVAYSSAPADLDPSAQFYQDSNAIMSRLMHRTLTAFSERNGTQVLVPDLATDLGTPSADGLTWTFTLKDGIKYSDGTPVTADDVAYAVKRSFAFTDTGPTYQVEFLKGGAKEDGSQAYAGPFADGEDFAGVEAKGNQVIFHLAKKWETLPYFASFTQTSPVQKAKDPKDRSYGDKAATTGPYMIKSYTQGSELVLTKNANWDKNTDPTRHQYIDEYQFKFGQDLLKVQNGILASNGPDAYTLNWDGVDASLIADVQAKPDQLVTGASSCTIAVNMDTRKLPMEVRKAIATAYPFQDHIKAAGLTTMQYSPASTLIPPQIPGHLDYTIEGVDSSGKGDPAKAKEILKAAGKEGFELVWYYVEDDESGIAQKVNQVRKKALEAAGFKVKDIGAPTDQFRALRGDPKGPHNMLQSPGGWCFDWPSADSIFPPTVSSVQLKSGGTNWGNLQDPKVDAELNRINGLPISEQGAEWGKFDKWLMENYLPAIPFYFDKSNILFGTKVKNVINDPNHGMPILDAIWIEQ
jgi:peptide/nickel transport system substrate-binding protein